MERTQQDRRVPGRGQGQGQGQGRGLGLAPAVLRRCQSHPTPPTDERSSPSPSRRCLSQSIRDSEDGKHAHTEFEKWGGKGQAPLRGASPRRERRAGLGALAILALLSLAPALARADDPPFLRELYVPYEEFQRLAGENPDGIVVDLDEYRALVLAALARHEGPPPPLPPVAAAVTVGRYVGVQTGERVRIDGRLEVQVTGEGWVRCPLGAPLPNLGSILVDDAPGWVVVGAEGAWLLLRGVGKHEVRVGYTVALGGGVERAVLDAPVVPAAAGSFEIEVPGAATGNATVGVLAIVPGAGTTRFEMTLGAEPRLSLEWRRERTFDENPLLLAATHHLSVLARLVDPRFAWEARIEVARRRTGSLRFSVPSELAVVSVIGDLVHAWNPTEGGIEVTLREAASGIVTLRIDGAVTVAGDRISFAPPRLEEAASDRGVISVFAPARGTLSWEERSGVEALDPSIGDVPRYFPRGAEAAEYVGSPPAARLLFTREPARIAFRVLEDSPRASLRQSWILLEELEGRALSGVLHYEVLAGRLAEVTLEIPALWRVRRLERADAGDPVRFEEIARDGRRLLRLIPPRALETERPLVVRLELEPDEAPLPPEEAGRSARFALPRPLDARLERTEVGLELREGLLLSASDFAGWRTLPAEEILALERSAAGRTLAQAGARLAAGIVTEAAEPAIAYTVIRPPAQGESRSVTHLLAAERSHGGDGAAHSVRLRTDIQVIVLDRAIDTLIIEHPPLPESISVRVFGDGVREVEPANAAGRQTVRFVRPWLGMRQVRVEVELPAVPGTPLPFPEIGVGGGFGGARYLAVQSQGSVEVDIAPGPGLARVELDDLPDFAEPWGEGRLLEAFRHRRRGGAGTFTTVLHDRAPVLTQLARTLTLTTTLGRDGTSRTEAEIELSSAREQTLLVDLPTDARAISVTVDGVPIPSVRAVEDGAPGAHRIAIPLPARSNARLTILVERPAEGAPRPLGISGSWSEEGPRFTGVPVGETRWTIHVPEGVRVHAGRGGNLIASDPRAEERVRYFASSFFGALLRLERPRLSILEGAGVARPRSPLLPLGDEEAAGAASGGPGAEDGAGRSLAPKQSPEDLGAERITAVRPPLLPVGRWIALEKYGGDPRAELEFRDARAASALARTVFLAALLGALALDILGRRRALLRALAIALFAGTFLPPAIGWESPLLAVPLCEGLVAALAVVALRAFGERIAARARGRRLDREALLGGAGVRALVLPILATLAALALLAAGPAPVAAADEPVPALPPIDLASPVPPPFDTVIVPYAPEEPPWRAGTPLPKALIPAARFRELWRLAHPEELPLPEELAAPVPLVVGAGIYRLEIDGERFRLRGEVPVAVLEREKWVELQLPAGGARLERVLVDGVPVGTAGKAAPTLPLRGAGIRMLELEWIGEVRQELGVHRIETLILAGPAARIAGILPPGAEVDTGRSSPGLRSGGPDAASVTTGAFSIDVGSVAGFSLVWSYPRIEGDLAAQVSSVSYSELTASDDRLDLVRIELVTASGRPVDRARYRIEGAWQVAAVDGDPVAEWSVSSAGDASILEVRFPSPREVARFRISGFAPANSDSLPTLTLEGAVRQESYVGLRHGLGRRFAPEALAELDRASVADASAALRIDGLSADRVHHAHGSAAGARLSLVPAPAKARVESAAVARIAADRLQVFVRTRFVQAERGPLRLRMPLPDGWTVPHALAGTLRRWEIARGESGSELILELTARAAAGLEVIWSAEFPYDEPPAELRLPAIRILADDGAGEELVRLEETVTWTIASVEGIDLATAGGSTWEPVPLESAPPWVALLARDRARFAYRTARPEAALAISLRPRASRLRATTVSFAHLGEEALTVHSRVVPVVRFAGRDRFSLRLPAGAELVSLSVPGERSRAVRSAPEGTVIDIELLSPVLGAVAIDLLHRTPRAIAGEVIAPASLAPIVVLDGDRVLDDTEAYVGVVQPEASLSLVLSPEGLAAVERERVPFLPAGVSAESIRATWGATAAAWRLGLAEEEIVVEAGLAALVPLVDITTRIGADGTMRTECAITLRNERLEFLAIDLPPGAVLWGVTVDGNPVAVASEPDGGARGGDARLRIPVDPAVGAQLARNIVLTYEEGRVDLPSLRALARLAAPEIADESVRVVQTIWTVRFPDGYAVAEIGGRMRQTPPSARHAEQLRQLMEQQQEVIESAKGLKSKRAIERNVQQLAKIEQQLGDSLAGLSTMNRSAGEYTQAGIIGEQQIEQQWAENDVIIRETKQAQEQLKQAREAEAGRAAEPPPDENAFRDRALFLHGKGWRGGSQAAPLAGERAAAEEGAPPAPLPSAPPAPSLLSPRPYAGWDAIAPPASASRIEIAEAKPVDPSGGLAPLPDAARLRAAAGLPPATPEAGAVTYTFRSPGAEASLELRLTQEGAALRVASLAALALGAIALLVILRRRR